MPQKKREDVPEMLAMYLNGASLAEVGKKYNISRERVRSCLKPYVDKIKESGGAELIERDKIRKRYIEIDKKQLFVEYMSGESKNALAKKYGIPYSTLHGYIAPFVAKLQGLIGDEGITELREVRKQTAKP